MRRFFVLLILIIVVSLLVPIVSAQSLIPRHFAGAWFNTDVDGSSQITIINAAGGVFYFDDGASVCGVDEFGEPIWPTLAHGSVINVDDSSLVVELSFRCLGRGELPDDFPETITITYTYNSDSNTLTDSFSNEWYRR